MSLCNLDCGKSLRLDSKINGEIHIFLIEILIDIFLYIKITYFLTEWLDLEFSFTLTCVRCVFRWLLDGNEFLAGIH